MALPFTNVIVAVLDCLKSCTLDFSVPSVLVRAGLQEGYVIMLWCNWSIIHDQGPMFNMYHFILPTKVFVVRNNECPHPQYIEGS